MNCPHNSGSALTKHFLEKKINERDQEVDQNFIVFPKKNILLRPIGSFWAQK